MEVERQCQRLLHHLYIYAYTRAHVNVLYIHSHWCTQYMHIHTRMYICMHALGYTNTQYILHTTHKPTHPYLHMHTHTHLSLHTHLPPHSLPPHSPPSTLTTSTHTHLHLLHHLEHIPELRPLPCAHHHCLAVPPNHIGPHVTDVGQLGGGAFGRGGDSFGGLLSREGLTRKTGLVNVKVCCLATRT